MTHVPYRATTCRGRELNYGSHIYFLDHTRTMEGLPGWVIGAMPGPSPRQHKHERQYTPSTLSHPNKANMEWWWRRPNDIRGPWGEGAKVSWHLSYRWGKTPKKPHPGNLSRPGREQFQIILMILFLQYNYYKHERKINLNKATGENTSKLFIRWGGGRNTHCKNP